MKIMIATAATLVALLTSCSDAPPKAEQKAAEPVKPPPANSAQLM